MRVPPKKKNKIYPLLNLLLLILGAKYFHDQTSGNAPVLTLGAFFSGFYLLRAIHAQGRSRDIAIVLVSTLVPLTVAEFWFASSAARKQAVLAPLRYANRTKQLKKEEKQHTFLAGFHPDADLGYAAIPSIQILHEPSRPESRFKKLDVVYSIDSEGHRQCPASDSKLVNLFFGDSFTFGVGLKDEEALPVKMQSLWQNRIASVNYSQPGYAPHQMLRLLETGRVDSALKGRKPVRAIFIAIAHHSHRVSGYAGWGWLSPHYRILPDGEPEYAGSIAPKWFATLWIEAGKSFLAAKVEDIYVKWLFDRGWSNDVLEENSKLLAAILKRSNYLLQRHYGIPLEVILWVKPGNVRDVIARQLKRAGVEPRWPEEIAGVEEGWYSDSKWKNPHFEHPSALAIDALARGLFAESNVYSVTRNP